jgi:hypothetical protein
MPEVPTGLVDRVLSYADRPWRVVAIIFLGLFAIGAYAAWEQRAQIAQHILQAYVTPKLQVDRFPAIAQQLLTDTGADLVVLAQVDLPANQMQNVDGRLVGDPGWHPLGRPLAILSEKTPVSTGQMGQIINGQVVCFDVVQIDHLFEAAILGMKRSCISAVPPITGVLIGALTLSWSTPPGPASEESDRVELARQAMKLATW